MKKLLETIPEFYYIGLGALTIIYNYYSEGYSNYVALLVTWLIFLQVFYKHKLLGLIYGNVLALFSVYMLLNVVAEFRSDNSVSLMMATRQFSWGVLLYGLGLVMAVVMVYKYAVSQSRFNENELTITY